MRLQVGVLAGLVCAATLACAGAPPRGGEAEELASLRCALAGRGARHDDATRYRLPFDPSTPRRLAQGVGADLGPAPAALAVPGVSLRRTVVAGRSHTGRQRYAFDFVMPTGAPVLAARGGTVACAGQGAVFVRHADGTFGLYLHLSRSAVAAGQRVEAGARLGESGSPGGIPHLHFSVVRIDASGQIETLPIRFADGTPEGFTPVQGQYYGGS